MNNQQSTLIESQQECEDILMKSSKEFIPCGTEIDRVARLLIESTYRQWTDILGIIHGIKNEPWKASDECEILQDPQQIPKVMSRVMEQMKSKGPADA